MHKLELPATATYGIVFLIQQATSLKVIYEVHRKYQMCLPFI